MTSFMSSKTGTINSLFIRNPNTRNFVEKASFVTGDLAVAGTVALVVIGIFAAFMAVTSPSGTSMHLHTGSVAWKLAATTAGLALISLGLFLALKAKIEKTAPAVTPLKS